MPTVNKHGLIRSIPEDIKRQVRQRCGFGCVVCGLGIYEYEHFSPEFKDATSHVPEGITLLCPNHHAKKTKGTLSIETVKSANGSPKALTNGYANENFDLQADNPVIKVGGAMFLSTSVLLQIEDEAIISITPGKDEPWLLNARLRGKDGEITMLIEENEWRTPSDQWDCKAEGNRIEIRSAQRHVVLVIRQEPPDRIIIERLSMHHRGYIIDATENRINVISPVESEFSAPEGIIVDNWAIGILLNNEGGIIIGCEPKGNSRISPAIPGAPMIFNSTKGGYVGAGAMSRNFRLQPRG